MTASETSSITYENYRQQPEALIGFLVEKDALLSAKDREIAKLQRHLYNIQKGLYSTKSERLSVVSQNQLELIKSQELPATISSNTNKEPKAAIQVPAHTRAARTKRDLSKLPHEEVPHEPESTKCPCCDTQMSCIGTDRSEELESTPAKLVVKVHTFPRYACNKCKGAAVVRASAPSEIKPLKGSIVGAGLLAQIIVAKYVDHIPLHRQEVMFARRGYAIPRKSQCEWVGLAVQQYLERLWLELGKELNAESYLQADETTLKVQVAEKAGECVRGYLWGAYAPGKRLVRFEYAPSRAGEVAAEVFKDFRGVLQTDLYAGYNAVILPDAVTRIACLAHVRRKFVEVQKSCSREAQVVLEMIAGLYKQEHCWSGLSPPERGRLRHKHALPKLRELEQYLRALAARTLPQAPLMEALQYTLKQWDAIERIFSSGAFQLDNNPIEREMRPIALGRKNYLFAGSHAGAHSAAIIYSLLGCARLHKVNPTHWLTYVFKHMRDTKLQDCAKLLPHHWASQQTL